MGDGLHIELDALRDALWDQSELSHPVVFVSDGEPPEHVRLLMQTLGVRIEVQPVSGKQAQYATGTVTTGSLAAQDYRASIAAVHRREQAGDAAVTCASCGTETDVRKVAHSPSCSSYVAPAAPEKKPAEPGKLTRGRGGRQVTSKVHSSDGSLTISEMDRREQVVLDGIATTTSCAFDGCEWRFEGTAADAIAAAAAHRAAEHPDAGKRGPSRFPKQGQSNVQADIDKGLAALEAMDAGEPQPRVDTAAAGRTKWTRKTIVEAIKAFAAEHGRPPGADTWRYADPEQRRPTTDAVIKAFGKWSGGIAAAGFERPTRGRRTGEKTTALSEREPQGHEERTPAPPASLSPGAGPSADAVRSGSSRPAATEPRSRSENAEHREAPPGLVFALITAARAFLDTLEQELG